MATRRGALILIEGVDRAGKSTQCTRLTEHLKSKNSINVNYMRFPDRQTPTGQIIDQYLRSNLHVDDHSIHLLYSANRWEVASNVQSTLASGTSIVMDRYAFSGVAYSHAKGLPLEWCKAPDRGLPAPDVVIFLDVSVEVQMDRGQWGGERYEKCDFQKKVAKAFECLKDPTWIRVDGARSFDEVHTEICKIAEETLEKCQSKPFSSLWETEEK